MRPEIEQAIALLQRDDSQSLEEALSLLQNTVFSFSMRVCGQREDAEDTTQEVLVKSLSYLSRFENPKALLVWLYKVAKNRCLMSRRKSKFAPQRELSLEELMPGRQELEQLADYLDEKLDDSLCEELEKHLDGCEPCKAFLSSLEAIIEQCRKSPSEYPDPKKAAKLRQQLLWNYERALKART